MGAENEVEEELDFSLLKRIVKFFLVVNFFPCLFCFVMLMSYTKTEWYGRGYYLEKSFGPMVFTDGYHLYMEDAGEKVRLLPHVYNYKKKGSFMYFAAGGGYGIIDLRDGMARIVFTSDYVRLIESEKIVYLENLSDFSEEEQNILTGFEHKLICYLAGPEGMDTVVETVGDNRFFYERSHWPNITTHELMGFGLYGDFDQDEILLKEVTGYLLERKQDKLYVTSTQGYAIIDGPSGICRIYFTDEDLKEKAYEESIQVLEAYEDFTPEERRILEQVEDRGLQ